MGAEEKKWKKRERTMINVQQKKDDYKLGKEITLSGIPTNNPLKRVKPRKWVNEKVKKKNGEVNGKVARG